MDKNAVTHLLNSINNATELADALKYATEEASKIDNEAQQVFEKQIKAHRFIEVLNQMKKTIKDYHEEEPEVVPEVVVKEKELN